MEIVDANVLLRYLLNDHEKMHHLAKAIIEERKIFIPNEVIAETVYVLEKLYKIPRMKILSAISNLLSYDNLEVMSKNIITEALSFYTSRNLDFVDSVLLAQNHLYNHKVHTFDKKLNSLLKV